MAGCLQFLEVSTVYSQQCTQEKSAPTYLTTVVVVRDRPLHTIDNDLDSPKSAWPQPWEARSARSSRGAHTPLFEASADSIRTAGHYDVAIGVKEFYESHTGELIVIL
jgi:hypothetical protein